MGDHASRLGLFASVALNPNTSNKHCPKYPNTFVSISRTLAGITRWELCSTTGTTHPQMVSHNETYLLSKTLAHNTITAIKYIDISTDIV